MNPITNAQLDEWATGSHMGYQNSVEYLRPLTPEQRAQAIDEAIVIQNTTPGYNFSGAVWQAVKNVQRGDRWGQAKADALMAYDPTGEKAAAHARNGGDWDGFASKAATPR